ncbi:MAG: sigma-70 family RNA polymerase sigma factor [Chloroflexi bacterium]|nr:sigma-70 family RNA polymerase sigma factor [Chloroflexota bacterium]
MVNGDAVGSRGGNVGVASVDDERLWVLRAQQGDQEAFANLVEAYQRPVYSLAYRMLGNPSDAEDAAQEVFVRAFTHMESYDATRKFSSWILSIASHYCIDRLRRGHGRQVSLDDMEPDRWLPDTAPAPESEAMDRDREEQIRRLLALLPEQHRLVIILRYWHDLSYEEIAQVTSTTESAVKSRLHRAREAMAEALAADREAAALPRAEDQVLAERNRSHALYRAI